MEAKKEVDNIQSRLVSALKYCIEINHPLEKQLFGKVLVSLVSLRELTIRSNKALPKIQQDSTFSLDPFWEEFIRDSHNWYQKHI